VNDILVRFRVPGLVSHVPAETLEERVDELSAELLLVVPLRTVIRRVGVEALDEFENGCWGRHVGNLSGRTVERTRE
jgi:hypothetical protein